MINIGDFVEITDIKKTGKILEINERRKKIKIATSNYILELSPERVKKIDRNIFFMKSGKINSYQKSLTIKKKLLFKVAYSKLDFHGYRASEVLRFLDSWVGEAHYYGLKSATIIHGKGDGVLQKTIKSYFEKNIYAKTVEQTGFYKNEGATLIEFF